MRIIYHHRTQSGDAQGIHIQEIIHCFRQQGHEVKEVALVGSNEAGTRKTGGGSWLGVLRNYMPKALGELMEIFYTPVGYLKLARTIRYFRPDMIYERYALYNAAGVLASRRFHIPLILEVNSPMAMEQANEGKLTFQRFARATEGWICSHSYRTLCVSTPLKEILVDLGVAERHIVVMNNGVDPDQFHGRDTGHTIRAKYGLVGKRVAGFVGWVRRWHGLAEVTASMADWPESLSNVHLLIVGDGPARPAIEQAARSAGVEHRVHITGTVSRGDMADYIAAMDVALQPAATTYASPMKVFEYLAMGKPVVAPQQPNLEEILSEGVNGRFFKPGDWKSLSQVLQDLIENREKLENMGTMARHTVFERGYLWCENARRATGMVSVGRRFRMSKDTDPAP